jgi:hypothetical protein
MDATRLDVVDEKSRKRIEKYKDAKRLLMDMVNHV